VWNFRRFLLLTQPIAPVEYETSLSRSFQSSVGMEGTGILPIQANVPFKNRSLVYTPVYYLEGLAVYKLLNYGHKKEGDN
jgi:hypothetical protein